MIEANKGLPTGSPDLPDACRYPLDSLDRADMAALVQGDPTALDRIMDRHSKAVFRFLYHLVGTEADAADLAQETFVRVYLNRAAYRPEQVFTRWLFTIAANLGRNLLRTRARRPAVSLEEESNIQGRPMHEVTPGTSISPEEQLSQAEVSQLVRTALAHLPEEMREAVVLCELEERSVAETAEILRVPARTVESRLYRARQLLRERLRRALTVPVRLPVARPCVSKS